MQRNVPLHVRSQRVGSLELDAPEEKWKPFVFTHFLYLWPSCTFNPPKCSRLIHKNMSIATRDTKLKLQIPQSRNYSVPLCEYLLVTALDLQAVLLSLSSNSALLCYETKLCCHNFTIYDLSPPPLTHTKLNTLDFGMKTMADLRQMNLPPMCILLKQLKQLIAVWQGHSAFRRLCI